MTDSPDRPRRFDLVVFDWDGTLFDSTALIVHSIQAACADLGLPVPDVTPEQLPLMIERYRFHYIARQHYLTLFPGVLDMLHALKRRHHWLAVATGKSRAGLDDALHAAELRGVFDGTRTADETRPKPDPQMLQELMRQFGADPDRTLMIGDTTHDLQLAANAGAPSVAVAYGAHPSSEFATHSPLLVAASVAELAAWLEAHA